MQICGNHLQVPGRVNGPLTKRPRRAARRHSVAAFLAAAVTLLIFSSHTLSIAAPSGSQVAAAEDRLAELVSEQAVVGEQLNQAQTRLEGVQQQMAAASTTIDRLRKGMATKQQAAVDVATELYQGGSTTPMEAVLGSENLNVIQSRIQYLESSQVAQTEVFQRLAADRTLLDQQLEILGGARRDAAEEQETLADLKKALDEKVSSQRDEIASLQRQIAAAQRAAPTRSANMVDAASQSIAVPPPSNYSANPAPAPNGGAQAAVAAALSQEGKPYVWGAAGPDSYDCSGLMLWAWAHAGVSLPHSSAAQYTATSRVAQSELQPGDLVFYYSPIHHVAMYIGNSQMVEAPYSGTTVRVVPLRTSDYVGAGRPGA